MGGKFVVRAGQHKFESGEKVVSHFPILPTVDKGLFNVSVQLTDRENIPYKNKAYFAITESGKCMKALQIVKDIRLLFIQKNRKILISI